LTDVTTVPTTTPTAPSDLDEDNDLQEIESLLQQTQQAIDNNAPQVLISVVLDQSGSMDAIRQSTIDGFNEMIQEQIKIPGDALVSLIRFDSTTKVDYVGVPIDQVQPLTLDSYIPDGMTALYDAIGETVERTDKWLADQTKTTRVIVVILTDGGENSSRQVRQDDVKNLISRYEESGWTFTYIGANQDAILTAGTLGIAAGNAINFKSTAAGARDAYQAVSYGLTTARNAIAQDSAVSLTARGGFYGEATEASDKSWFHDADDHDHDPRLHAPESGR